MKDTDKKFLFINLSIKCGNKTDINHGVAFLVPILKKYSYDVAYLNIHKKISHKEFRKRIEAFNPSIVGFSTTSHQLKYLIEYSRELEKYPRILPIAGGVGSTLEPELILSQSSIKGVCIGEGEIPLGNLLSSIENGKNIFDTHGFYWLINGKIKKNLVPQFISDLSATDFPDYSILGRESITYRKSLFIMLSRGCPYDCHYCCNRALSSVYPSSKGYFRMPSVQYSIRLIERMVKEYPETEFIEFEDDLLIANKIWFEDFSEIYHKKINIPYRANARVECVTPEIAKALKQSGCKRVYLGLESGNEYLRNNLLNRKYSNSLFIEKCETIKAEGLELFTFNIVGFPFEGRKEMEDTLELNKKIAPNQGLCFFFYPYKGTELYKICKRENLLKSDDEMAKITNYTTRPAIEISAEEEKECIYFQRKISNYLCRQKELTEISHLPPMMKKYLTVMYYWFGPILGMAPFLHRMIRRLSILLGLRALVRRLRISS